MYILRPGDRVIVDADHGRFNLEVVNVLGERVELTNGLSSTSAQDAAHTFAYKDQGRVWACHHAAPGALRPLGRAPRTAA